MAPIGPTLPPHLSKRKRTPDDEGAGDSPSPKRSTTNNDEIALDDGDDSDDGYGPSAPKSQSQAPARPFIGPSLPPPAESNQRPAIGPSIGPSIGPTLPPSSTNTNEIALDDSDSDSDTGPAPAPAPAPKRVLGPAPPPAPLSERPTHAPDAGPGRGPGPDSDSDSDDDYGPALPTSTSHLARQSQAQEAAAVAAANPRAPQRDDWMLAPPSADSARRADPTQIRARKFNSGPRAAAGGGGGGGGGGGEISSIWTETPEQKRQRLENAVLGRAGADGSSSSSKTGAAGGAGGGGGRLTREEEEKAARIRANLEAARGPSLYAEHQRREGGAGGRIEAEEDDPSARGFDWEKDMRSGSRIGTAQRKELMSKASDFGGRFSKGKFL
ncbi:hypothetical protein JX265_011342 [Neoarthrinium moseri]|uniref:DUF3752 domain-containing protein n=1 Tax=Neoarthrinium moseri TaxID=1658444 RepID=A0A9P9WCK1_9PEZI|nr:hypothetical protein JX265_011342 [Neoarthrinium moseri]